ncbi:MAG: undecaprenyldiphospho-muramoylpentapeptide beta-N-acetylglucosaminyltransferase [Saprospiraceae bacterium]|nr:undecaprenyldiphospho-muramoylpentapeptide beta-N-acetylglucosaminyltransferase [Saprospiraceae bacterium]
MSKRKKVIVSGGGTGGHIFPAIAIADALKRLEPNIDILFVGASGRMEMEKVPLAGYPIKGIWISGFQRKLSMGNLLFPAKLMVSLLQAATIVRAFKPDLAIGVGGFASGPLLQVACRTGVKSAIQEQNALPGATNKILAKQVDRIFVAYPGMEKYFPNSKLRLLGNPVRQEIETNKMQRNEALTELGLDPQKRTILVFGGSLGAGILNACMADATEAIRRREDIQIIWQTGKMYAEKYKDCATAQLENVRQMAFIEKMHVAYAAADLVVCRAGALTISEISILAKAAILVPSPFVAEDHQTSNAKAMEQTGAVIHISQHNAPETLIHAAFGLIDDPEKRQNMSDSICALAYPGAADNIAKDLLSMI